MKGRKNTMLNTKQKEFVDYDENNDKIIKHGKYQWFNYKGLTYLKENPLWEIL